MNRFKSAFAVAVFMLWAAPSLAHDEFRFVGTVTKLEKTSMQLKAQEPKPVTVKFDGQTLVTKDKKKVEVDAIKTGDSVVVDALGDSYADLLAVEVRIVPPIGKAKP
jgi:hypothetical protein